MAEIINLRRARKTQKRREKEIEAEQNRLTFGRSKQDLKAQKAVQDLETRKLDAHRRETPHTNGDASSTHQTEPSGEND
jgi:hypothetical protein